KETTFDWTLNYDEVDYVIEGTLDIIINGKTVSASAGELILIPKGSSIQFSVKDYARFIYVTYPADWASQN
ncbi:cupin domain-containing protein, partial [Casaltella massiliensis]|nr:cupin domain-containing protein [Casaltella massiliensis]